MWILLKQETVRGSGITRAICNGVHLAPDRQPCQHPTTQFLQAGFPSCRPTNGVKALKANKVGMQVGYSTDIMVQYYWQGIK